MTPAEWIKCTSDDDEIVYVNIALATVIEPHKKGCRIRSVGDSRIDLRETRDGLASLAGIKSDDL